MKDINSLLSEYFATLNAFGFIFLSSSVLAFLKFNELGWSLTANIVFMVGAIVFLVLMFGFTATVISIGDELREIKSLLKEQNSR